ncbi:MAG: polysaccharide deacetylase [Methylocystis sp.]
MTADMISISRCIALSGLGMNELVLGVSPTRRHDRLLANYVVDLGKRSDELRDRIVRDIRASLSFGATGLAADLVIVLRLALARRARATRRRGARRERQGRIAPSSPPGARDQARVFSLACHARRVAGVRRLSR